MGQSDLIAQAADQAIGEVDQLKRKGFLKQYGFGQACGYIREGRSHLLIKEHSRRSPWLLALSPTA
jgi:hypothetical protein